MTSRRRSFPLHVALAVALCALTSPELAAQSAVLTTGPGGDFLTVQAAVNAAANGDTIVVLEGGIEQIVVDGKSLRIIGTNNTQIFGFAPPFGSNKPTLEVRNLPAGQSVTVRSLALLQNLGDPVPAVVVRDCAGAVHFEGVRMASNFGYGFLAIDSSNVTLAHCEVYGGVSFNQIAATGFEARGSVVSAYDSVVHGGPGVDATDMIFFIEPPGPGGPGVRVEDGSTVLLNGCEVTAGTGGSAGTGSLCFDADPGGNGIEVLDAGSLLRLRDTSYSGAPGGTVAAGCSGTPGVDGEDLVVVGGTVVDLPGTARSLATTDLAGEGALAELHFSGEAGDFVTLLFSPVPGPTLWLGGPQVALHLLLPTADIPLGVLPGTGELTLPIVVPQLPGALNYLEIPLQAFFRDVAAGKHTSGPSVMIFLDSASVPPLRP